SLMFRWRKLPGKIPGKDELRARISQLQERVDKKEGSLLEKQLILEEIAKGKKEGGEAKAEL
ncbi:MAG: hypothetical protein Q9225_007236, partial [Loekoesia sp. 1 TL-2023]